MKDFNFNAMTDAQKDALREFLREENLSGFVRLIHNVQDSVISESSEKALTPEQHTSNMGKLVALRLHRLDIEELNKLFNGASK